jgi:outer membrane protein assembly factor BamB
MGAPEVLGSGVYCFSYDGQSLGASAQNVTEPLSSADFLWTTPDNGLVLFEPLATTTNLGCSSTLDVPAGGGVALAKFNGGGACQWNELLALPSAAVLETNFQVAHDGTLVAAVVHAQAIDFGGGPLQPTGPNALALAHFDPSGSLLWAKSLGGGGATIKLGSMGLDPNGRILVTATYAGSVDLGAGPLPASDDTLLAVFDTSGNLVWSKTVTVGAQGVLRAAASDGAVVIATDSPEVDLGSGQLASVASIRVASVAVP